MKKLTVNLPIENASALGVVTDLPSYDIIPEGWTNANNMRFRNNSARRMEGHAQIFGTPNVTPSVIFNVPAANDQSFWFYMSLTKAWVVDGGVHADVTRLAADFTTSQGRHWTMALLAGIPIFNNQQDVPQWWPALSAGQHLEDLPNWPATFRARTIKSFGAYLIAMNLTEAGTNRPHKVLTSHRAGLGAVPSSWDVTDPTKDARSFELTDAKGGELMDGLALGDQFIFYKKNSTHTMRFIGGSDIWKRDRLFETSGILNTRCVCNIKKGTQHFVVTQNDIILHGGSTDSKSIVEGKNKETVFGEIDPSNYLNSFCFENVKQNEAWFVYPTVGNVVPNKAFIFDYEKGTSTFRDMRALGADSGVVAVNTWGTWDSVNINWDTFLATTWDASGREGIIFASPLDVKLYQLDIGFKHDLATPTCFVERIGLRYNHPKLTYGQRVIIPRIWPRVHGPGKWNVRVGMQEIEDGPITWSNTFLFDPALHLFADVHPPANGRLPAVRFESVGDEASRIRGYNLEIAAIGDL